MSTELILNVKHILCENVYIISDGHFLAGVPDTGILILPPREDHLECKMPVITAIFCGILFVVVDLAQVA